MRKKISEAERERDLFLIRLFNEGLLDDFHGFDDILEKIENEPQEPTEPSRRHKLWMNRLFRENVGGKYIPYPEVDNAFQRVRSRIVILWEKISDSRGKKK